MSPISQHRSYSRTGLRSVDIEAIAAIIPAAGRATRMAGVQKELLPLGLCDLSMRPAPAVAWSLYTSIFVGARRCTIVTVPEKSQPLRRAVEALSLPLRVRYHYQPFPTGMADAVFGAANDLRVDDVALVLMPDTILWPPEHLMACVEIVRHGMPAAVTVHCVDAPERFAPAVFSQAGAISGFVEKPVLARSPWTWTSVVFRHAFLEHMKCTRDVRHGSLTPSITHACKAGELAIVSAEGAKYCDIGTPLDYTRALERFGSWVLPEAFWPNRPRPAVRTRRLDALGSSSG